MSRPWAHAMSVFRHLFLALYAHMYARLRGTHQCIVFEAHVYIQAIAVFRVLAV